MPGIEKKLGLILFFATKPFLLSNLKNKSQPVLKIIIQPALYFISTIYVYTASGSPSVASENFSKITSLLSGIILESSTMGHNVIIPISLSKL